MPAKKKPVCVDLKNSRANLLFQRKHLRSILRLPRNYMKRLPHKEHVELIRLLVEHMKGVEKYNKSLLVYKRITFEMECVASSNRKR